MRVDESIGVQEKWGDFRSWRLRSTTGVMPSRKAAGEEKLLDEKKRPMRTEVLNVPRRNLRRKKKWRNSATSNSSQF
jgi:hypothetical protein